MLKRYLLICLSIIGLLFLSEKVSAQTTCTWVGGAAGVWNSSANWNIGGVVGFSYPGNLAANDIVDINSNASISVSALPQGSISQLNIANGATVTLTLASGMTLKITGSATVGTTSAATLNFAGPGDVTGASAITVNTNSTLTANTTASITAASLTMATGTTATLNGGTTLSGAITVNGTSTIGGSSTISAASMTLASSNTLTESGNITLSGACTVNNAVTPTVSVGSGYTLTIGGGLTVGSFSASSITFSGLGTESVSGSSTLNQISTITVNASNTLQFNAASTLTMNNSCSLTNGGTVTGATTTFTCNGSTNFIKNTGTFTFTGGAINFTGSGTGAYINNSGTFTISASCTITLGNNTEYIQNTGTFTAGSSTFNMSGSGAYMTNSSAFKATACTFTFGNGNNIQNNSGATFINQPSCVFTMNTSGSYITNAGTWTDHGSTFNMGGQSAYLKNTYVMKLRGATVNLSGGSGNAQTINNTDTLTVDSSSTINANNYISGVINTGVFKAGTSNSSCIINLTAQSSYVTSSSTFYLGSTSIIYPTAISTYITNTSPGVFTLQSDAFGTAAIGPLNATVGNLSSVNGTFNCERFYQGSTTYDNVKKRWLERNYRIISSPVHNTMQQNSNNLFGLNYIVGATAGLTTTASSTTNAFITGCASGSTSAGNPSIYLYRESYTPSNATFTSGNFLGINDIGNSSGTGFVAASDGGHYTLPIGNGIFFFRGAATNWATRTVAPYIAPENVTLTTTGLMNTFSVNVKDWYNPTSTTLGYTGSGAGTNNAVRGFNMIGNPYPCTVDWCSAYSGTGIIRSTTVAPTIWVFNPQTNQYDTFLASSSSTGTATGNASRYIMSGQGFFVQALTQGSPAVAQTLTFTESAKAPTQQLTNTNLLMGTPTPQLAGNQVMRLKLTIDSLNYDDIAIVFNPAASTKYSNTEDALYIRGSSAPEGLSSFSDDSTKLAINSLPLPGLRQQVIRLSVDATYTGTYTLLKTQLDAIPKLYNIWLMDDLKKDSLDIRNNSTYVFDVNASDTTTFGDNRFRLIIRQNPALMVHLLNFAATKATSGSQVIWTTENEQNYTNFTLERSTNGGAIFTVLGGVASNAQGTYSFLDKSPVPGANSYRLKIVDLNGVVTYSNIVTLMYANTTGIVASNIRIYPNPASSVINLAIDQNNNGSVSGASILQTNSLNPGLSLTTAGSTSYDIKIINMKGAIVKTASTTEPSWQQGVSDLSPGTYVINVINKTNNTVVGSGTFIKL